MSTVSVVIPVYNVEKYLSQCLDSVCNQSYNDIEILCVNDCSPDNSLEILEVYAKNDSRIKIINRLHNGGLSAARNTGLDHATGEYVYFIDSDDWIDIDYIENMMVNAQFSQSNIILNTNIFFEYENKKISSHQYAGYLTADYQENIFLKSQSCIFNIIWNTCCHFYKLDFLKKYNLRFPEGFLSEDLFFQAVTYSYSDEIFITRTGRYHYRIREDSICGEYRKNADFQIISTLKILKEIYNFYSKRNLLDTIKAKLFVNLYNGLDKVEDFEKIILQIKNYFLMIKPYVDKNHGLYLKSELSFFDDVLNDSQQINPKKYLKIFYFDLLKNNKKYVNN